MINTIDTFLNKITMYKVVLYYLVGLWVIALGLSIFNFLSFTPAALVGSLFVLLVLSWATNTIFSKIYEVPANVESVYITAFILALIITPVSTPRDFIFLGWAAILAMASKYIFAIKHKHIWNPAAFAVALTAFAINGTASWWLGTPLMAVLVCVGGLLLVRKILRADLTLAFALSAIITTVGFSIIDGKNIWTVLSQTILYSPLLFFTFVMITEPLTTPPSRWLRIAYGALVGFLFAPQIHIGGFYLTPELALLIGNIFSYSVSPKQRLVLTLKEIVDLAPDTKELVFATDQDLNFKPGQYLEWTLEHETPDLRGNRRYFTIASSPLEKNIIRLGVKFYPQGSTFKQTLLDLPIGSRMNASQLAGDFTLPNNKNKKVVFIAGGIGITPFKSMISYMVDIKDTRDTILLYANKSIKDIAYRDFFDQASKTIPLKTVHVLNTNEGVPMDWNGYTGFITADIIKKEIPDYLERTFYISGPHGMVTANTQTLKDMGITDIKTDFFPGFA